MKWMKTSDRMLECLDVQKCHTKWTFKKNQLHQFTSPSSPPRARFWWIFLEMCTVCSSVRTHLHNNCCHYAIVYQRAFNVAEATYIFLKWEKIMRDLFAMLSKRKCSKRSQRKMKNLKTSACVLSWNWVSVNIKRLKSNGNARNEKWASARFIRIHHS